MPLNTLQSAHNSAHALNVSSKIYTPFQSCLKGGIQRRLGTLPLTNSPGRYHICLAPNERLRVLMGAQPDTQTRDRADEDDLQLEGISRTYCDDFVCTSSPQVEQNAKALARETTRLTTWSKNLFRKDVQYKDPFLSFKGTQRYDNLYYVKSAVKDPKVLVTSLRMLEKGSSQVEWRLRGNVGFVPIDVSLKSTFILDLITGRVKEHNEEWDLSRCSPAGKLAFLASRLGWSIAVKTSHISDDTQSFIKDKFQSDNQPTITADPSDPTKFFQDDLDPTKDLLSIGAIIAFIYFIFKAYGEIEKL